MSTSSLIQLDRYRWRIPKETRPDMRVDAEIFISQELLDLVQDQSLTQCMNVATLPGIVRSSIAMPDIHQGYGFPIGGVAAMDPKNGVVSPGGVGFDINCGVRLLKTDLTEKEIRPYLDTIVKELAQEVPSGAGRKGPLQLTNEELDEVLAEGLPWTLRHGYATQDDLDHCEGYGHLPGNPDCVTDHAKNRGGAQLGTLGSGNHFMEIQVVESLLDEEIGKAFGLWVGQVLVMIHSGSRGLGHQVGTDYIRLMGPVMQREGITVIDRQLACAPIWSEEGRQYLAAMASACNFAWCNRQLLAFRARDVFHKHFQAPLPLLYDVAHNIAKFERHQIAGKEMDVLVHRKGATRAFPPGHRDLPKAYQKTGQPVLIPGDMGRNSYILAGLPGAMELSFGSVCHGAGRMMSRTAARARQNFYEIERELRERGVVARAESRSGITEEAPDAYKDVNAVVEVVEGAGLAKRVAKLRPLGVIKG